MGLLIANEAGIARLGFRSMDDHDWVRGEEAFKSVVSAASLQLGEV